MTRLSSASRSTGVAFAAGLALLTAIGAAIAADFEPVTTGGVRADSHIVTVSSLAASGPGTLAWALQQPGPKVIVFTVGGVIPVNGSVTVNTPFTTIAGETAPAPGIELAGGTLQVRTHDVVVRHLAVRTQGPAPNGWKDPPDGINVGGNPMRYGTAIRNVLLENVSVSWGVDENVDLWYQGTGNIQLRSMIIAEGLMQGGHPKGVHSMGMLVGSGVDHASVTDSLFAHNNDRHPRVSPDTQVDVERNVVYDPGHEGTQVFVDCDKGGAPLRLVDNVLKPGPDTWHKLTQYDFRESGDEDVKLAYGDPDCAAGWQGVTFTQPDAQRQQQVFEAVLAHAGSRPAERDATDARIVAEARSGGGGLKDHGEDVVAGPAGPAVFTMPADPFAQGPDGRLAIADALCRAHLALGGLPYAGCA